MNSYVGVSSFFFCFMKEKLKKEILSSRILEAAAAAVAAGLQC